jgi:ribonuclease R
MQPQTLEGPIAVSQKGIGFFDDGKSKESIEIQPSVLKTALHRDTVKIKVLAQPRFNRRQGEVVEIVHRAKSAFVGVAKRIGENLELIPDDKRCYLPIVIAEGYAHNAKDGEKIFVKIKEWKADHAIGEVVEVIGMPGIHETEMRAIVLERGFAYEYPVEVVREAEAIAKDATKLQAEGADKRRDMRDVPTCTIDPVDAKDFDDALSMRKLPNGHFEVGVHIADVSHFVHEGTALDKEARERGFSVYLVDRTIPMLPEVLSNNLCSLNPNEDKCAFSAVFEMDEKANIYSRWFGKTFIRSIKRFTYETAQETLNKKTGVFSDELTLMNTMAKIMRKAKEQNGAIDFEKDEIKFVLDDKGVPIKVIKKSRGDSHKLVEEFMLLANREVAHFMWSTMEKKAGAFMYRIHDVPDLERIENLSIFARALGHELPISKKGVSVKDLQALMRSVEGTPEESIVKTAAVRSMSKAVYSTQNIGHYGLAFEYYTHFTSPIRRYADLIVHRLLQREIENGRIAAGEIAKYESIAKDTTEKEIRAADAERASVRYKQIEYMQNRRDEIFEGTISGVIGWGIYIEEKETLTEGMVHITKLPGGDFYVLDEKNYALVGQKSKRRFTLGDKVRFKIVGADLEKRTLDYQLVD